MKQRESKRDKERARERERERERDRRHIDVHAFRLVHICNANLRGDRGVRGERRTEKGEMDGARGGGDRADRKGRPWYTRRWQIAGERESTPVQLAHDITVGYAHTFCAALPAHHQRRPSDFLPFSVAVSSTPAPAWSRMVNSLSTR